MFLRFLQCLKPKLLKPKLPSLGKRGESEAEKFLLGMGFELIARNWRCKIGEIDLVMKKGDELVIVEVKTRQFCPRAKGRIFDPVDMRKQRKLKKLAEIFKMLHAQYKSLSLRIDLVGVVIDDSHKNPVRIEHIQSAL